MEGHCPFAPRNTTSCYHHPLPHLLRWPQPLSLFLLFPPSVFLCIVSWVILKKKKKPSKYIKPLLCSQSSSDFPFTGVKSKLPTTHLQGPAILWTLFVSVYSSHRELAASPTCWAHSFSRPITFAVLSAWNILYPHSPMAHPLILFRSVLRCSVFIKDLPGCCHYSFLHHALFFFRGWIPCHLV